MQSTHIHELRVESRSNVFVMAALYADGRSVMPVRVRNISQTGALVEGAALPPVGTPVRLSRASLSASGSVIWLEKGKAGLRFEVPVGIADWLPQGRRGIGQQFVDELFHQKRLGGNGAQAASAHDGGSLAEELLQLRLSLERAGEALVQDGAVASRHGLTLQSIDCVAQALARLAAEAASHSDSPLAAIR